MTYLEGIILGLVQGLAEFLPVSSSGHLALLQNWFGIESDKVLLFTILLHVGTLVSVCFIYGKDIWELIVELVLTIKDLVTGKGLRLQERPIRKFGLMIIVATIPTMIIGLLFDDLFDKFYNSSFAIAMGLIITGVLLWVADNTKKTTRTLNEMNFRNAIFVGCVQGIAICPGISRSGSTLFGSLTCKLEREFAVKFVFILSVPAILGSAILEVPDAIKAGIDSSVIGPVLVGMIVAAVSGIFAIKTMVKIVSNKKLKYFSYYVWAVALVAIVLGFVLK